MPNVNDSFLLGVDEAGRGPVIGPLVVAGVKMNTSDVQLFRRFGITDSKKCSPQKREDLSRMIRDTAEYSIRFATPEEIDHAVRDRARTLNGLELELMADILQDLRSPHIIETTIDAPGRNILAMTKWIQDRAQWTLPLELKHFADTTHIAVSAASILAKVERDHAIESLKHFYGTDIGSGYPSDPKTKTFLKHVQPQDPNIRWTWKTMAND